MYIADWLSYWSVIGLSFSNKLNSSRTAMIHPITTLSTLSYAFAKELLIGLARLPSTNPSLLLSERAIIMTLFQFAKPLPKKIISTSFWLLSDGYNKYIDTGFMVGSKCVDSF